jgi:site-specific recombinase XerD
MNLLDKFLEWLKLNKNSEKTVMAYFQQVDYYGKYCQYNICQETLNNYLIKLREDGKSNNTINSFKRAMIAYTNYSKIELEFPKWKSTKRKGIKYYFNEKDLESILRTYYDEKDLILRFMFYFGARPSELKNLEREHINFNTKDIIFYNAKGNKDRNVPFLNNKLYNDMKAHCESLTRGNVFSITYCQLKKMFKDIKRDMNIADHEIVEPRTMRISFAKYCLTKGMDISYLKKVMGHTNIAITELYAEPDEKMIKEICEKIRKEK